MIAIRIGKPSALIAAGALVLFLLLVSTAYAAPGHRLSRSFGTTVPGQLTGVRGVALRTSSDDVVVADPNASRVLRYTRAGDFLSSVDTSTQVASPTSLARDPATGDVYIEGFDPVTFAPKVARYSFTSGFGAPLDVSAIASIGGIAVDPGSGEVYVSDSSGGQVHMFSAAGVPDGTFGGVGSGPGQLPEAPTALSVDGSGNVYVVAGSLFKYTPMGASQSGTVGTGMARLVAADPVSDEVYVLASQDGAGSYKVDHLSASGALLARFGGSDASAFVGLAVDGATQNVFATNFNTNAVDVYVPFVAPGVTTGAASNVTPRSADIGGSVDPAGQSGTQYFAEYGVDTTYGQTTDAQDATGAGAVSISLGGLQPNTTYHYRVVATNPLGRSEGDDQTFQTSAAAPEVSGESASAITPTSASVSALVNANGTPTTAHVDYGINSSDEESTMESDAGSGNADRPFSAPLTNLQPDTTYRYKVVATNGVGAPTEGAEQTFRTLPAPPVASVGATGDVSGTFAVLNGAVDTQGLTGSYRFIVSALNSPYSYATPPVKLSAAIGSRPVSSTVGDLPSGGVFEVRLRVATTTGATVSNPPSLFSTAPGSPPLAPRITGQDVFPYGCAAPRINTPRGKIAAGQRLAITGSDLGVTGTVAFGSRQAEVSSYTPSRVDVVVPSQAKGKVALTVTCGKASNSLSVNVASRKPSNRFELASRVSGESATLTIKVPSKGTITARGSGISSATLRPSRAGTVKLRVKLTKSAASRLRGSTAKKVSAVITVRYRPTGGIPRQARRRLSFTPQAGGRRAGKGVAHE